MLYRLRLPVSRVRATARAWPEITELARWADHRMTPVDRKPRYHRLLDLAYISLRWGEVSSAYYSQGADRTGHSVRRDFLPYPEFRRIRDSRNRRGGGKPYDYVCLLQDKRLFERYFGLGGLPVIPTVCELHPEGVQLDGGGQCAFTGLAEALGPARSLFCKPRHGIHGHDAFCLDTSPDGLLVDGEPTSPQALGERLQQPYLCQERLVQHADLARPHPRSVNTVRIVTVRTGRTAEILFASLRLGADGAVTDNGGATRVIALIHPETGRGYEIGYWRGAGHDFTETTEHPQTHVPLRECQVPFYRECLDLVRRAHDWLPAVYSVGWDLAITPDGPRLVEGNDDWSGATSMVSPEIRQRFLALHDQPSAVRHASPAPTTQPKPHGLE